jgi:UDP-N-acetylglucosamine:LPS N-acetylglucosamine transferase
MAKIKICLACSAGGHLTELIQLNKLWKNRKHYWVSDERSNAIELSKKEKVYFVTIPAKKPARLIKNFIQSLNIFLKENPDLIISTGADVEVPTCLIAKTFGKKVIYIESFAAVFKPSKSGEIMNKNADLFFYQWKQLSGFYPNGKYGRVL